MANNFTGVLGTANSQPGQIEPGAIPSVGVSASVSPVSATVNRDATQVFTASNFTGTVTWSIVSGGGSLLTTTGVSTTYTPPNATASVVLQATDGTNTVSINITVPAVVVTISPSIVTLGFSTTQQFTASVTGLANTTVTWTASASSITTGGLFTSPASVQSITITALAHNSVTTGTGVVTVVSTVIIDTLINFGAGYSGLAGTIGYAVKNFASNTYTIVQARTISGIVEIDTGTGIYRAQFVASPGIAYDVEWDTGGSAPIYDRDFVSASASATALTVAAIAAAVMSDVTDVIGVDILAIKAKTDALSATPAADSTANLLANVRWQRQEAVTVGAYTKSGNIFTFTKQDGTLLLVTLDSSTVPTVRTPGS